MAPASELCALTVRVSLWPTVINAADAVGWLSITGASAPVRVVPAVRADSALFA